MSSINCDCDARWHLVNTFKFTTRDWSGKKGKKSLLNILILLIIIVLYMLTSSFDFENRKIIEYVLFNTIFIHYAVKYTRTHGDSQSMLNPIFKFNNNFIQILIFGICCIILNVL